MERGQFDPESGLSDADLWERKRAEGMDRAAATAYVRARQQGKPKPVDYGFGRAVTQGVTFGFGDELEAGAKGLLAAARGERFGDAYSREVDAVRRGMEAYKTDSPVANFAGETIGALAPAVATGGLGLLRGAAAGAKAVAPSLLRRVATAAGQGAAQGALAGAGTANGGPRERATGALWGGLLGGGLGGAVSSAAAGVPVVRNLVTGGTRRNAQQAGDRLLTRALGQDGETLRSLRAKVDAGRVAETDMLLDIAGENTLNLTDAAHTLPGKGRETIRTALDARKAAQPTELGNALEQRSGVRPADVYQKADELMAQRKANAKPLYEKAYEHGVVDDERLDPFLGLEDFHAAWAQAKRIAELEGVKLPEMLPRISDVTPEGTINFSGAAERPTVQHLDYLKRGLDDVVRAGQRAPLEAGGMGPTRARAVKQKQREMLDIVDELVPDYKAARAQFAGDLALEKALEMGRKAAREDARLSARRLASMTDGEKEMFRLGLNDALRLRMQEAPASADLTKRLMGSDAWRDRVRNVFPDDASFAAFLDDVGVLSRQESNRQYVRGNSATARRLAGQKTFDTVSPDVLGAGAALATGNAIPGLLMAARAGLARRSQGINAAVADAAATRLTARGPQEIRSVLDALGQSERQQLTRLGRERGTARLLGAVSGLSLR